MMPITNGTMPTLNGEGKIKPGNTNFN